MKTKKFKEIAINWYQFLGLNLTKVAIRVLPNHTHQRMGWPFIL